MATVKMSNNLRSICHYAQYVAMPSDCKYYHELPTGTSVDVSVSTGCCNKISHMNGLNYRH